MWCLTVWLRPASNHVCEELSGLLNDVGRFNPGGVCHPWVLGCVRRLTDLDSMDLSQ